MNQQYSLLILTFNIDDYEKINFFSKVTMGIVALHSCSQEEELDFPVMKQAKTASNMRELTERSRHNINAMAKGLYIVNGKKILK